MKKQACPGIDAFLPGLASSNKWEAIEELTRSLAGKGLISDVPAAIRDIVERERSLSTGLTGGVAIPHTRTSAVLRRCCAVGVSRAGIDFDSIDGFPVNLVFLVLSTHYASGPHLECLAEITHLFSDPEMRRKMIEAADLDEARRLFK